jgi:4-diphosphocytidyl-2-C-methyl-D-erythritol kinase
MREIAAEVGADVPFFLSKNNRALGTARGDRIEEIDVDLESWYLLVMPDFEISSKEAYDWVDGRAVDGARDITRVLTALKEKDAGTLAGELYNELEGLALRKDRTLSFFKEILVKNGAGAAIISGSGPVLFGIFQNEGEVDEARRSIMKEMVSRPGWRVAVASTLKKQ